jgi:hypothetical protein
MRFIEALVSAAERAFEALDRSVVAFEKRGQSDSPPRVIP